MNSLLSSTFLILLIPVAAQETPTQWEVRLPPPVAVQEAPAKPVARPLDFTVLKSLSWKKHVTQAPPMPGLPPVTGTARITVQRVAAPDLPDPPPPLPALPPNDPAVTARMEESREALPGCGLAFVSATIHQDAGGKARTFLQVHPDGRADHAAAWSNVDFRHFTGFASYRVHLPDGSVRDIGLIMGVGPAGSDAPEIPALPDAATAGPAFVLVEGTAGSPAGDIVAQAHELYRKEGQRMEAAFHAREAADAARRADLLANPPKPDDITIRFWRRNSSKP